MRLLVAIMFVLSFGICADRGQVKKFTDKSEAMFEFLGINQDGGSYRSVEVNYQTLFIAPSGDYESLNTYFAKLTTKTDALFASQEKKNIKVDIRSFENPKQNILTIEKDCDKIDFNVYTYKTTTYGCCAGENRYALFDYKNRLIIEADAQLVAVEAPNSKVKLYIGFTEADSKNSTTLGDLTLSYGSLERYTIRIQKADKSMDNSCTPFAPDIEVISAKDMLPANNHDAYFTYRPWSLDKIKDKKEINDFGVKLTFECFDDEKQNVIEIPISNGLPFGKNASVQNLIFGASK